MSCLISSFYAYGTHWNLHSFPTRRSSDLPPEVSKKRPSISSVYVPGRLSVIGPTSRSEEQKSELQTRMRYGCSRRHEELLPLLRAVTSKNSFSPPLTLKR